MKQSLFLLLTVITITAHAQSDFSEKNTSSIRLGGAYVRDFPGLNGAAAFAEYSFPINEWFQAGIGLKHIETSGYPRVQTIKEYTRATTIDLNLMFVPYHTDNAAIRIGTGYSLSRYNAKRSYPVFEGHGTTVEGQAPTWKEYDAKGWTRGVILSAEYEYYFESNISIGAKIALSKAYSDIVVGGPFVSVRF